MKTAAGYAGVLTAGAALALDENSYQNAADSHAAASAQLAEIGDVLTLAGGIAAIAPAAVGLAPLAGPAFVAGAIAYGAQGAYDAGAALQSYLNKFNQVLQDDLTNASQFWNSFINPISYPSPSSESGSSWEASVLPSGDVLAVNANEKDSYYGTQILIYSNSGSNVAGFSGVAIIPTATGANIQTTSGSSYSISGSVSVNFGPSENIVSVFPQGVVQLDPQTGAVLNQGAISATIPGSSGSETVTLLGLGGSSPFALISNDNSSVTASAVSSNVLAYLQGPVARTAGRSYRRRVGSLGISHDRGSARTDGGTRLWGFIRQQGGGGSDRRLRIGVHGRSLARKADGFVGAEHRAGTIGIVNSVSAMSAAHTLRLPGRIGPVTMSRSHDRTTQDRGHDVSLGFGGLG